jgi:hypothetical protein
MPSGAQKGKTKQGRRCAWCLPPLQIEAVAEKEHRSPRELVGKTVERDLSERRYFRSDEVHPKIEQGLEAGQGRGLDAEAVMAELLAALGTPCQRSR